MELLHLRPGDQVLDVGCGTGLNFPHLQRRIGAEGSITGVDASSNMLDQARRRAHSAGWDNVHLVEGDATALDEAVLGAGFDVALSTYALSLMPNWPQAVALMTVATRPGGRVAVVDMQRPTGRRRLGLRSPGSRA